MSSIPNAISASVAQAALQQSQTSRTKDAQANRDAERSRKMRQMLEKHVTEVEDPSQADASQLRVRSQQQAEEEHQRKHESQHDDQRNNLAVPDGEQHQIDLQA